MKEGYSLEKLKNEINVVLEGDSITINIYAIVKNDQEFAIKRVKFDKDLTSALKAHMEKSVRSSVVYGADTSLMDLSECDARRDVICKLDMDIGGELSSFVELNNNHGDEYPNFDINSDLSRLSALVVDIDNSGHQMQIYNHIYPMEILGKNKFMLSFLDDRLTKVDSPLLLINNSFQALQINGNIVITNMKFIEKHAGYQEIIKQKATLACSVLKTFGCIENIDCYEELVETDITFARKLSRVSAESPVIKKKIPHARVITPKNNNT